MEPLHDIKSAARQLSLSTWGVRYLISRGHLRPVRIGRLVRIEEEELRRFVTQNRDPGGSSGSHSESESESGND